MIKYKSTRGDKKSYSFSEVILNGIAPDGGLFVPEKIPVIAKSQLKSIVKKSYAEIALYIFEKFQTNFSKKELKRIISNAYGTNFDIQEISPVKKLLKNQYVVELWHGPTTAFKDMALQLLPLIFSEAIKKHKKNKTYLILTATSGDTGSAALSGFKDKNNSMVMALYPHKKTSHIQELQMISYHGKNQKILSLDSDFDAIQKIVKDIFTDTKFAEKLSQTYNVILSSANSINWGRLLPQIVYYFHGYKELVKQKYIILGEEINITIPTGNFGNILAGWYAKKMGLPIHKLICASNENNVLSQFIQTGMYDISGKKLKQTPSPSMDILVASNIERLLYEITLDEKKVKQWVQDLKEKRKFHVDAPTLKKIQKDFDADWVNNTDSLKNIKHVFEKSTYLLDPHTSVAQNVATLHQSKKPMLIMSTAHWAKFPKAIAEALEMPSHQDDFVLLAKLQKTYSFLHIPKSIITLQHTDVKQESSLSKDSDIKSIILDWLNKQNLFLK